MDTLSFDTLLIKLHWLRSSADTIYIPYVFLFSDTNEYFNT